MTLRFARSLALAVALAAAPLLSVPVLAREMLTALPKAYTLSDVLDRDRVEAVLNSGRSANASVDKAAPARALTTYHPSRQVSARVRRLYAEWMADLARAKGGRRVAAAMAERDPVRGWAKTVGAHGLRPGDMVDAVTGYWMLNWMMANGGGSTRTETQAVRRQVQRIMASSIDKGQFREAERQEISEVLMLNTLMQRAAYRDAMERGDQATVNRLGEEAVARFRQEVGIDLRALKLTKAGFVKIG